VNSAALCKIDRHTSTKVIDAERPELLIRWSRALGVSPQQLQRAVLAVGNNPDIVRRHVMCGNASNDAAGPPPTAGALCVSTALREMRSHGRPQSLPSASEKR